MAAIPGRNGDGFRIVHAVLALSETADLLRTLEASQLTRSRAGARHLMKHPAVSEVANDPRLLAIASAALEMLHVRALSSRSSGSLQNLVRRGGPHFAPARYSRGLSDRWNR
jgi:hypothetical protein